MAQRSDPGSLHHVLSTLRAESPWLKDAGVRHAFVFGSVARGDDHDRSDIDIAIDAAPSLGSPAVMDIEERLAHRFGRPVQIVSKRGLRSARHASILREMIEAF